MAIGKYDDLMWKNDIWVRISYEHDWYIAEFPDAMLSESGDTIDNAVEMLMDRIGYMFLYCMVNRDRLGKEWVLEQYISVR